MTDQTKNLFPLCKTSPIWLLRQAGRYMPEYMKIRNGVSDFLELCYDSDKASRVTMQPIERYDLDAAILFADILLLPDVLGWDVAFKKGEGPVLKQLKTQQDLKSLKPHLDSKIDHIYDTVRKVRSTLSKEKSLIGFAGSPWTVASYMIEGRGKHDFSISKSLIYSDKATVDGLIDILTEQTIIYLVNQVRAGADIVMLFDSWSGVLNGDEYDRYVIEPTKKIVSSLKSEFPTLPIIGFPRGSGYNYDSYIDQTGIDVVSVDQFTPLKQMRKWQEKIIVQGNLDPVVLLSDKDAIMRKVDDIFSILDQKNFIFNLGHGILPTTNPENVEFLVEYVREVSK